MTSLGVIFRPQRAPEELRAVAKAADEFGIDELWLWEDCFDEGAVASAAAALAWTQRLHVGIGIMPVPLRNPALAAMEIASLARMFGDRVHIGVGHGVLDWMARVGVRAASPMTLLREYVTALQAGDTVTTEGDYVRLREVKLGWAPHPKPALHVGAIGPKTTALAGELADGLDADADAGTWGDAEAIAATVRRWSEAGADAVVLQPTADEDPVAFARFAGEQVRPLL